MLLFVLLFWQAFIPPPFTPISATGQGVAINADGTMFLSQKPRVVTGATDTISNVDCGSVVIYTSKAKVSVTVTQPGVNMPPYCPVRITDEGSGGLILRPNSSMIGGFPTLTLLTGGNTWNPKVVVIYNDGKNYRVGEHSY